MSEKILKEAKEIMGDQFNEEAWKNLIEADSKKAEDQLKLLKSFGGKK